MKPIEELKTEHRAIESSLKILGAICDRVEEENLLASPEHIDGLIGFFRVFADQCHHGKEETQLFAAYEGMVEIVDCDEQECDVTAFPTWEIGGERHEGRLAESELRALAGC